MENKTKSEYLKGLFFNEPHEKAPDFIIGSIAIKRLELIETLQNRTEENIRLDCKLGREGKGYATINNYKNEVGKAQNIENNSNMEGATNDTKVEDISF